MAGRVAPAGGGGAGGAGGAGALILAAALFGLDVKRRWRWAAAALLAMVATGLLGWQALRPVVPRAAAPASASSAPAVALPAPQDSSWPAGARPAKPAAVTSERAIAPVATAPKPSAGTVEVCGYGRVNLEELEASTGEARPSWAQAVDAQYEAERSALVRRLAAGPARQRVAAALLSEDVQLAAQIAASADDPAAYQLALAACRRDVAYRTAVARQRAWLKTPAASGIPSPDIRSPGPEPHNCAALSVEKLEQMAPEDATPWLMRLSDALARSDDSGVSQALYQIAQRPSRRFKARALSGAVADAVGAEPTPGETLALSTAVGQDMQSVFDVSMASVGQACRNETLRDANRRQLCEQVVRQMAGQVSELIDARVLFTLEERLGLAHGPSSLARDEGDRLTKALSEQSLGWFSEPNCANFSRAGRLIVDLARQGELAYLRKKAPAAAPR